MARNLRPKGVSSTAGRGDTPRLAAAIVAHLVGAVVVVVVAVLLLLLPLPSVVCPRASRLS